MSNLIVRKDGVDPYPEVKLRGAIFQSIIQSMNFYDFQSTVDEWLAESSIKSIDPEKWYPRQEWLNLLKKLENQPNSTENQVAIGTKVVDNADIPDDLITNDVNDAIGMLNMIYVNEQQNLPEGDTGYEVKKIDDNNYEVLDMNPYLVYVNYGYIWGILKRFLKQKVTLKFEYLNPDDPAMGGVLFKIALS